MHKKGQAAMEFLMTYGWAILAAIIAIGVLAYFGVFSPGKYVTGSAVVNPPFYVNAWNVQALADFDGDGTDDGPGVTMELRNNGGEDYELFSVTVTGTDAEGAIATCTYTGTPLNNKIEAGKTFPLTTDCGPANFDAGDTFKGDVTIVYQKENSDTDLTSTGTIAEKITA